MSDEAKKNELEGSADHRTELRKPEGVNFSELKIDPKLLKDISIPTNAHSALAGGKQDESIGIDFGNGNIASRQYRLAEGSAQAAKPESIPTNHEETKPPILARADLTNFRQSLSCLPPNPVSIFIDQI